MCNNFVEEKERIEIEKMDIHSFDLSLYGEKQKTQIKAQFKCGPANFGFQHLDSWC